MKHNLLSGHISPETAYLVADYPYGFRLRCQIRYWLDVTKHGVRFMSQTTNPKKPGLVWNKPKASTYARFGGAMYLDENGHVQWSGLSEYSDTAEALTWRETYGPGVPETARRALDDWCAIKMEYDRRKTHPCDTRAAAAAVVAVAKTSGLPTPPMVPCADCGHAETDHPTPLELAGATALPLGCRVPNCTCPWFDRGVQ